MPIYEYTCKRCGNFETMQGITEEPLKKCPTCGAKVTKLISRSAFHLKGSGWYATDYGKNSSSSSKTDDSKPTTSETKTSTSKDDGSSATSSSSSAASSTTKESSAASSS
jgi:putative FmdB family regulatory protein